MILEMLNKNTGDVVATISFDGQTVRIEPDEPFVHATFGKVRGTQGTFEPVDGLQFMDALKEYWVRSSSISLREFED